MRGDDTTAQFQRERLHSAAQDGDLAGVERWLAASYPVNRFDFIGKTPLHYAVAGNHVAVVERLLKAGANPNAHDERWAGDTPLGHAIGTMTFAMAERLINAGADPTIPGWMGRSALSRATDRTDADAAKVSRLLERVARPRSRPDRR